MAGRFIHEALEAAGLPELAGAGIGGVDRELRRQQHGVDAGIRNLLRHQLAVAHVAFQRRAVAVEEHHDHAGLAASKCLGDVHQHAVVVVGLVLPVDPAAIAAVALAIALGDVQERRVGARIVAEIGEGRGFHADQRGQLFALGRARQGQRRRDRAPRGPARARAALCCVLRRGATATCRCSKTFLVGREAILELRRREAVFERVAGWRLRVGGQHCRRSAPCRIEPERRTAAQTARRRRSRRHRESGRDRARPANHPVRAIMHLEFRIRPDHPPTCPKTQPANQRDLSVLAFRRR